MSETRGNMWSMPHTEIRLTTMSIHAFIEPLEARIAPANLLGSLHGVLHFTDVDGDKVTITASHGNFTAEVENSGQLDLLDLSIPSANMASITVSVVKVMGGDGLVNVPRIDGGTNNFGAVTIKGDLGEFDCGSGAAGAVALVKLNAVSVGKSTALYQSLYGSIAADGISGIEGTLVSLKVTHDVNTSYIRVGHGANIGSVTVGGSIFGGTTGDTGEIYAQGNIGTAVIKKDIVGGSNTVTYDNDYSGSIGAGHGIHSITVSGSLIGGTGMHSGSIYSGFLVAGDIDKVNVAGDLDGRDALQFSGGIYANGTIHFATVGGNLRGGNTNESGSLGASGDVDNVLIKGSLFGGGGNNVNGSIYGAHLGLAIIKGDIVGGTGNAYNGSLFFASIGKVKLSGSLIGGFGNMREGIIYASGDIGSVTIGGSIMGDKVQYTGAILAGGHLGSVEVMKNVTGLGPISAVIEGDAGIDLVHIHGNLSGGTGFDSGVVNGNGFGIKKIIIDGQIIPGTGTNSGQIRA